MWAERTTRGSRQPSDEEAGRPSWSHGPGVVVVSAAFHGVKLPGVIQVGDRADEPALIDAFHRGDKGVVDGVHLGQSGMVLVAALPYDDAGVVDPLAHLPEVPLPACQTPQGGMCSALSM